MHAYSIEVYIYRGSSWSSPFATQIGPCQRDEWHKKEANRTPKRSSPCESSHHLICSNWKFCTAKTWVKLPVFGKKTGVLFKKSVPLKIILKERDGWLHPGKILGISAFIISMTWRNLKMGIPPTCFRKLDENLEKFGQNGMLLTWGIYLTELPSTFWKFSPTFLEIPRWTSKKIFLQGDAIRIPQITTESSNEKWTTSMAIFF